jgi:hypothetical protein
MMDGQQFDRLSSNLAKIASRRGVLKGVVGATAGIFVSTLSFTRGRAAAKIGVCHHTGSAKHPVD